MRRIILPFSCRDTSGLLQVTKATTPGQDSVPNLRPGLSHNRDELNFKLEDFTMAVKVGINGFGRIGRNIYRTSIGDPDIDFVAVNDLTDTRTLAHLLKYDSVLGNLDQEITSTENGIRVENEEFRVFSQRDPAAIDWESVGAEIVVESTGLFTKAEDAKKHLRGSVKKVIISAPAKNEDITIVLGV